MRNSAAVLGILGDGQLALMLGESAEQYGCDFIALVESKDSPFAIRFPDRCVFEMNTFMERSTAVTLENEFNSVDTLTKLELDSLFVVPNSISYKFFESKISQRKFYDTLSIPGPHWFEVNSNYQFQNPFVLKKSSGGYDGYGVCMVNSEAELKLALQRFDAANNVLFGEEKVVIIREFAQGALFDGTGGINFLPLVETIQRNGICELVLSKSNLEKHELTRVQNQIKEYLNKIAQAGLVGLFNFEFFLTQDGKVLINEGAPRPHNSQHLTLNASPLSQFDLLVQFCMNRALPLPNSSVISAKDSVMINLLGKSSGSEYSLKLPTFDSNLIVKPKLYLKKECRPGRKMGHLNLIDPTGKLDLMQIGERALKEYEL